MFHDEWISLVAIGTKSMVSVMHMLNNFIIICLYV